MQKLVDPPEPRGQRRQRGRGGGDGGGGSSGDDSNGGLLGFGGAWRAARKPPVFDEERVGAGLGFGVARCLGFEVAEAVVVPL